MNRKTDIIGLDIPKDDIECWEKYPKHHWVYDLSRLLDAQNIKWSPYEADSLPHRELNIDLYSKETKVRQPGFIYIKEPEGNHLISEVYISKGEIKYLRHIDTKTGKEIPVVGEVELRLSAFVTLYFVKFTGVITTETYGNEIFKIRLRPQSDLSLENNPDIIKLIRRIYKRSDSQHLLGLTDRSLHETLAS